MSAAASPRDSSLAINGSQMSNGAGSRTSFTQKTVLATGGHALTSHDRRRDSLQDPHWHHWAQAPSRVRVMADRLAPAQPIDRELPVGRDHPNAGGGTHLSEDFRFETSRLFESGTGRSERRQDADLPARPGSFSGGRALTRTSAHRTPSSKTPDESRFHSCPPLTSQSGRSRSRDALKSTV